MSEALLRDKLPDHEVLDPVLFDRILESCSTFDKVSNGKDLLSAQEKAQEEAWKRCVRTFRGTDCKTPGVVFLKDIAYRDGNIAIWNLLTGDASEMNNFNSGKSNPVNTRHRWILRELGILEPREA
jgi:hypothetical protein